MRVISGWLPAFLAFILSLATLPVAAQTHTLSPSMLKAAGVLLEPIGAQELLGVLCPDGTETASWYLFSPSGRVRLLGNGLSQSQQIRQIAASPNHAWLAVLSASPTHPLVEIVDLRQLRESRRYVVLQQINPAPGTIHLVGWQEQHLIVSSNAPLARRATGSMAVPPGQLLPTMRLFKVTISTGRIEEVSSNPSSGHRRQKPH